MTAREGGKRRKTERPDPTDTLARALGAPSGGRSTAPTDGVVFSVRSSVDSGAPFLRSGPSVPPVVSSRVRFRCVSPIAQTDGSVHRHYESPIPAEPRTDCGV